MEEIICRFPHMAEKIFEELDNHYFIQCKVINPSWKNFMEESKFSYIRLIKTSTNCSSKGMQKILKKTNLEDIIRLASDVGKLYDELQKEKVDFRRRRRRKGYLVTDPSLTLFHMAAKHGSLSVCQLMINSLDDIHLKCGKHGQTPLHFAAESGHLTICQLILEKDEDKLVTPNPPDSTGNTPLHLAAENGHLSVCKLFMSWIMKAYPEGDEYTFTEDGSGFTPLHLAAEYGQLSVCQFLIGKVQNKNIVEGTGVTPLGCAARRGHSAICHLLIDSLVDVNVRDMFGQTALHFAAGNNLLSVCQKLLQVCIEHNPEDYKGNTPFDFAATKGHQEVCKLLSDSALSSTHFSNATFFNLLQAGLSKRSKQS